MRLPARPTVYEINTAVWLQRLGGARGRALTLGEVADREWDALAALPVDAVWLMGVWQRSPAGLRIALENPKLVAGNRAALPDLRAEDVIGSPYCVRDYVVESASAGRGAGGRARSARRSRSRADPGLRAQPRRARPPVADRRPDASWRAASRNCEHHPDAFLRPADGSSPTAAIPTSRRGPTSCS